MEAPSRSFHIFHRARKEGELVRVPSFCAVPSPIVYIPYDVPSHLFSMYTFLPRSVCSYLEPSRNFYTLQAEKERPVVAFFVCLSALSPSNVPMPASILKFMSELVSFSSDARKSLQAFFLEPHHCLVPTAREKKKSVPTNGGCESLDRLLIM